MKKLLGLSVLAVALVLVTMPLFAHHGGAVYDNKPIRLTGTVTKFAFVNPHILMYIDVKGPNGEVQQWTIEHSPPSLSVHQGWYRDMMKPGDQVEMDVRPAKNGSFVGSGGGNLLVNGKNPIRTANEASGAY